MLNYFWLSSFLEIQGPPDLMDGCQKGIAKPKDCCNPSTPNPNFSFHAKAH